jgi:hypothetical protein
MDEFHQDPYTLEDYVEKVFELKMEKDEARAIAVQVMKLHQEALPMVFVEDDETTIHNLRMLLPVQRKCPLRKHAALMLATAAAAGNLKLALAGAAAAAVATGFVKLREHLRNKT